MNEKRGGSTINVCGTNIAQNTVEMLIMQKVGRCSILCIITYLHYQIKVCIHLNTNLDFRRHQKFCIMGFFFFFRGKAPALLPLGVPQLQPWGLGGSLELSLRNAGGIWFKTPLPVGGTNTAHRLQRPGVWGLPQDSLAPGIPTKPPGSLLPDIGKVAHPLGWRQVPYWAAPKGLHVPGRLTSLQPEPRRDDQPQSSPPTSCSREYPARASFCAGS